MRVDFTPEKQAAVEKVLKVMKPYIDSTPNFDVVYSDKIGYLFLEIPLNEKVSCFDCNLIDTPDDMLYVLYTNLAFEYMEHSGHCKDYGNATPKEKTGLRAWLNRYADKLPEYNDILEAVLAKKPDLAGE